MTTTAAPTRSLRTSTPSTSLRGVVARHPVAVMVTAMLGIANAVLIPAARSGLPIEPFLLLAVLLAQLLPAVLVTAAADGRDGVRELFSRTFRWRVRPTGYLLALVALPVAALALATAWFGVGVVRPLVTDPGVVVAYLGALTILPIVNLWEETAVMGVIQDRLAARHGLLLGALLTAPVFALQHLALHVTEAPLRALTNMGVLIALAVPFRIMVGWLYRYTGRSILLVAALHATFNTVNNTLLQGPGRPALLPMTAWAAVALWAAAVVARGRRRRGAVPRPPSRSKTPRQVGECEA